MTAFILRPENARDRMRAAWNEACNVLQFGKPVRVEVKEARGTRSLDQNAMFHAVCGDIARQRQWAGRWLDTEAWKRLLVDAWARAEGKAQGTVVPSLDGESIVNLGIQTRRMTVGEMADLITFAQAWAVEHDVTLNEPRRVA